MADLGVKKGSNKIKNKKQGHVSPSAIKVLPNELLVDIFARVASCSIVDVCKVKLTCKDFLHAAEDDRVYHHASMENFALVPLPWFTHERESSFLKRCRESGNLEISYREGMLEYFSYMKIDSGLENLRKAAMDSHDEAKYVCCMILMRSEDEGERKQGFDLFRILKKSTSIRRCRKRVKSFVRSMWVHNPAVRRNNHQSLCRASTCGSRVRVQNLSTRWSSLIEDDDRIIGVSCECCHADYELRLFCSLFEA